MMLASHELARIFFAGESDEARIVAADAFDDCACLGAASIAIGVFDGVHRGHHELIDEVVAMRMLTAARRSWSPSIPTRTWW